MRDAAPDERLESARKPRKCPACGAGPVARILYGMPAFSEELEEELRAGKVALGGCMVSDDDPDWECTSCGQRLYRERR
jgi:predicted RNA-binding Zn-ribbon protein involved in translation (DUF1610 family)